MNDIRGFFDEASLIAAHDEANAFDAVVPPIVQTSLFTFASYDEMLATYRGEKVRPTYTRGLNPTVRMFEEMLARLEGAEDAIGFASGMSAISSAVLSFVEPGDRIVAVRHIYPDAFRLFGTLLKRMRVEVTYVDGRDEEAVARALPGARLFYMESPTSWVMETHEVASLASLARANGVPTIIDNSWATPVFQRPLSLGADIVVHSMTKYLNGHSDVVGGVIVLNDEALHTELKFLQNAVGAVPAPWDNFLVLRGLKTLHVRMERHDQNAKALVAWLRERADVGLVRYPGFGGMVSFELKGDIEAAKRFVKTTKIFALAESLGGVESLIELPAIMTHASVPPDVRVQLGIPDGLIRLSVGIEHIDDLRADLESAFRAAAK